MKKLRTKIFRSAESIETKHWESIFPSVIEGRLFFKTIDESLSGQFKPYYIAIYEKSDIVCLAPCFLTNYPLDTTIEGPLKKIISFARKMLPHFLTIRILFCGSPASEGRIGIKDSQREEITATLLKKMMQIAKKKKARLVAFKDFKEDYAAFSKSILRSGFSEIQSYPSVKLGLNFKSIEEYLNSLSGATRKDLRRKFKKTADIGIHMEVKNIVGESIDEIYELYLFTYKKSDVRFEKLTKEFFINISKNMPNETKFFLWHINDKLVAFDMCFVSKETLIDKYIGMDYNIAYKYHLYFLTFRDVVEWCIGNKIKIYDSDALSYDPKKRLDFTLVRQYIYVKHINPVINVFFKFLWIFLRPENFDKTLQSIKKKTA